MTNSHPLEVVRRGSETQLQVGENLNYLVQPFLRFMFMSTLSVPI